MFLTWDEYKAWVDHQLAEAGLDGSAYVQYIDTSPHWRPDSDGHRRPCSTGGAPLDLTPCTIYQEDGTGRIAFYID